MTNDFKVKLSFTPYFTRPRLINKNTKIDLRDSLITNDTVYWLIAVCCANIYGGGGARTRFLAGLRLRPDNDVTVLRGKGSSEQANASIATSCERPKQTMTTKESSREIWD